MSYKTILVNAQPAPRTAQIVACASRLALADNAHLVGLASTGLNELEYQCNAIAPGVPVLPDASRILTAAARQALDEFTAVASRLGVAACEARLTDDNLLASMVLQARYADLVVTGQTDAGGVPAAQLILHSPRPVLVVPDADAGAASAARTAPGAWPLLAWDGGMAASRASVAALPLLRRAALVTLAVINPAAVSTVHGPQAGADLAAYLARHGVPLEVVVRETDADAGDALLGLAAERGADLLVMGCYGHTRWRELLLGGATRAVLRRATLPLLMAH